MTFFAGSFTASEITPLIYFLVGFPVLVLAVFTWLVIGHSGKLFAPSDFKNEENYVRMQLSAAASLAVASAKTETRNGQVEVRRIVQVVQEAKPAQAGSWTDHRNHVLWVDDRPDNNIHERQAFEAMGLKFTLALSTSEALDRLAQQKFAAIISDMGREEGPREGYVLLDELRKRDRETPFFIYAGSAALEHRQETSRHLGQGCTNDPQELFQLVMRAVLTGPAR